MTALPGALHSPSAQPPRVAGLHCLAAALFLSEKTVKHYVTNILRQQQADAGGFFLFVAEGRLKMLPQAL